MRRQLPADKTYANQLKAAGILEKVFAVAADHPGLAHYLIHSYDYPSIAHQGSTRRGATLRSTPMRPTPAHAGAYLHGARPVDESIDTNIRSAKVSENHAELLHAMDYIT